MFLHVCCHSIPAAVRIPIAESTTVRWELSGSIGAARFKTGRTLIVPFVCIWPTSAIYSILYEFQCGDVLRRERESDQTFGSGGWARRSLLRALASESG